VDSQTVSSAWAVGAAWAAAGIAALGAAFQFFIGRKQASAALISAQAALKNADNAGRHTQAEFRQKWIDRVIDALSEHTAILLNLGDQPSGDERRKLTALRAKLELLLNPTEPDPIELMRILDSIPEAPSSERAVKALNAVLVARKHLKAEWVRIKTELS
jgi:hypothetical protein